MKRNIVIGPPGTGKTTFLKDKVEKLISGGYYSLTFVRFTRSLIKDYSCNNHRSWIKATMMTYHGTRAVSLLTR